MTDDIDAEDELFLETGIDTNVSSFVQPILFLPIGPPTFFHEDSEARTKLIEFGDYCNAPGRKPICIVCVSPRWVSPDDKFRIMSNPRPNTIHDFVGFSDSFYDIEYVPEGNALGAARIAEALSNAGIEWEFDEKRGFDFGCWSPLALLFPDAGVPVVQVSLHHSLRADDHIALGQILGHLRHDGYLLVCTGGVTHNPTEISLSRNPPPIWAETVDTFVASVLLSPPQSGSGGEPAACAQRARRIASGDGNDRIAAAMAAAHPAGTYLLPLLVAAAAGGPCAALHRGWLLGSLSMSAYIFGAEAPAAAARRHLAAMDRR